MRKQQKVLGTCTSQASGLQAAAEDDVGALTVTVIQAGASVAGPSCAKAALVVDRRAAVGLTRRRF